MGVGVLYKSKRYRSYWLSILAEKWVCIYLFFKGYRLLKYNFRCKYGEIDIIALKKKTVVFVEVKKRQTLDQAKCALKKSQQARIKRAAKCYLSRVYCQGVNEYSLVDYRFDLVVVDYYFCTEHIYNYIYN